MYQMFCHSIMEIQSDYSMNTKHLLKLEFVIGGETQNYFLPKYPRAISDGRAGYLLRFFHFRTNYPDSM